MIELFSFADKLQHSFVNKFKLLLLINNRMM